MKTLSKILAIFLIFIVISCDKEEIKPNIKPLILELVSTDCTEYGGTNGTITATATGGVVPYVFKLSTGTYTSLNKFTGLIAGTYIVYVKDKNSTEVQRSIEIKQPAPNAPIFTYTHEPISCYGGNDGLIIINITNPDANKTYSYSINNGSSYQLENVFSNLSSGTYYLKVKEDKIESASTLFTLNNPSKIEFNISKEDVTFKDYNDGNVKIIVTSGSGDYEYSIDDGTTFQTSNIFNNLYAGTYKCLVKNNKNCISDIISVTIEEPNEYSIGQIYIDKRGPINIKTIIYEISISSVATTLHLVISGEDWTKINNNEIQIGTNNKRNKLASYINDVKNNLNIWNQLWNLNDESWIIPRKNDIDIFLNLKDSNNNKIIDHKEYKVSFLDSQNRIIFIGLVWAPSPYWIYPGYIIMKTETLFNPTVINANNIHIINRHCINIDEANKNSFGIPIKKVIINK